MSQPILADNGNNFFSILAGFGDLSDKLNSVLDFFHYIINWILLSQLHNYIKNKPLKDEAFPS